MKLKKISLRIALMIPLFTIVVIIVLMIMLLLNNDYEYLASEQGSRILQSVNETTQEKLKNLLSEPIRINRLAAEYIMEQKIYDEEDLSKIENYFKMLTKQLQLELPQLSGYAYGDEKKRLVCVRVNNSGSNSLMLQDKRTNGNYIIYDGDNINTNIITTYEGYDPTIRPWYTIVKNNSFKRWSEVYMNYDETMEAIISSVIPVYNNKGEIRGLTCFDIRLSGISDFLLEDKSRGTGITYIVDKNWNLLAYSGDEKVMKITSTNPPAGELIKSFEFDNQIIVETSKYFQGGKFSYNNAFQLDIDNEKYYLMISKIEEPSELAWMTISVIPERDLLSFVRERQATFIGFISAIGILTYIFGLIAIGRIVKPIAKSSKVAMAIADGKWNTKLETGRWAVKESEELAEAFNIMVENLEKSFREIKVSEEKYRTLIENLENSIYSIDSNGSFLSVNTSLEKLLGQRRGEIIGKPYFDILKARGSTEFWIKAIDGVIATKEKTVVQYDYITFYNERKVLMSTLLPVLKENGELEMILGSNLDITKLVEAHEEIKQLQEKETERLEEIVNQRTEELKEVMKELMDKEKLASLGGIVSGVAHEINTPLGVAVTAASYMESKNKENFKLIEEGKLTRTAFEKYIDAMEETATILNNNLSRAAELVKSFKLIAVNQSEEVKTEFNLLDYINNVLTSLKHEYKNKNIKFNIECGKDIILNSYSGDYAQILTNFIMNSLIHGLKGTEEGIINIKAIDHGHRITIIYADNGKGISPENLNKIFDPFFTTNRGGGGSGLGLSVVYNIVTGRLGGKISCQSKLNEGTTFILEIPR